MYFFHSQCVTSFGTSRCAKNKFTTRFLRSPWICFSLKACTSSWTCQRAENTFSWCGISINLNLFEWLQKRNSKNWSLRRKKTLSSVALPAWGAQMYFIFYWRVISPLSTTINISLAKNVVDRLSLRSSRPRGCPYLFRLDIAWRWQHASDASVTSAHANISNVYAHMCKRGIVSLVCGNSNNNDMTLCTATL